FYPGQEIENNLDWVNVMTNDLFTSDGYQTSTQPPAPLRNPRGLFSADEGVTVDSVRSATIQLLEHGDGDRVMDCKQSPILICEQTQSELFTL
ncbi:hypothetical protein SESBI_50066, partial [Sesbania bispinosa]